MKSSYALAFVFFANLSFAGANFLGVSSHLKNLDYQNGFGDGILEHLELFFETSPKSQKKIQVPQRVEIVRTGEDFQIKWDYITLDWKKVPAFVSSIELLKVDDIDGHLGTTKNHFIKLSRIEVSSLDEWLKGSLKNVDFYCMNSNIEPKFERKLVKDCLKLGQVTVEKVDYPFQQKFLEEIARDVPEEADEDISRVLEDFSLNFNDGNFDLKLKTKILFKTRVKALGHLDVNLEKKQIVLRLDQVKIGLIPVTAIVWRELKKRVQSADVIIDPPYIRYSFK